MTLATKLRRAPGRLATGAFIVNAGLGKLKGDEKAAEMMHGMAAGTYPVLKSIKPKTFLKVLGLGELAIGGLLLAPVVPAGLAGAALTGFSGAMLNLYWKTPGMHPPGDPRPTQQGTAIAKDVWMLAIGSGLAIDALLSRTGSRAKPASDSE
jgi:hypothetical protein